MARSADRPIAALTGDWLQWPPECQAYAFVPGHTIAARLVLRSALDPAQPRYHHFHPAAEIVWFRRGDATLHVSGGTRATGAGDLVYLPSMIPHDFDVAQTETAFVLLFYDPVQEKRLPVSLQARLSGPLVLTPDVAQAQRLDMLLDWLLDLTPTADPDARVTWLAAQLLDLVLQMIAEGGRPAASGLSHHPRQRDPLVRLERAIALIHVDYARPLPLSEAAAACNLTPAYFARLFKARIGLTFAEYVQRQRLNMAAQLVGSSDLTIADVAWRTGFKSPAHLSARFSAQFGLSPTRYRAAARAARTAGSEEQDQTSLSRARDRRWPETI